MCVLTLAVITVMVVRENHFTLVPSYILSFYECLGSPFRGFQHWKYPCSYAG